jgi:predicted metal-binding membrane protein
MGLHFVAFVGMWALMMTAMMLPLSIALATRVGPRTVDASIFAAGYLLVWAATGVPVYEAARSTRLRPRPPQWPCSSWPAYTS